MMNMFEIPDPSQNRFYGIYRGKVVQNNIDNNMYGAIRVFIRDFMDISLLTVLDYAMYESAGDSTDMSLVPHGIIAYPANSPIGGYNSDVVDSANFQTSVYTPAVGSYVWVFFEDGWLSRPFYLNAFKFRNSYIPPENISEKDGTKVFTLIKTRCGRSIIVSDDESSARVEITGKRINIDKFDTTDYLQISTTNKEEYKKVYASGSFEGAYDIEGNMTTILLDERSEDEKFLIKTRFGDFFELNIKDRKLKISVFNNIEIYCGGIMSIRAEKGFTLFTKGYMSFGAEGTAWFKSSANMLIESGNDLDLLANGMNRLGSGINVFQKLDYVPTSLKLSSENLPKPRSFRNIEKDDSESDKSKYFRVLTIRRK